MFCFIPRTTALAGQFFLIQEKPSFQFIRNVPAPPDIKIQSKIHTFFGIC